MALVFWFWKWLVSVVVVVARPVLGQAGKCGKVAVVVALDGMSTVVLIEGALALMVVWALIWLLCLLWTLLLGCSAGLSKDRRSTVHTLPSVVRNLLSGLVL